MELNQFMEFLQTQSDLCKYISITYCRVGILLLTLARLRFGHCSCFVMLCILLYTDDNRGKMKMTKTHQRTTDWRILHSRCVVQQNKLVLAALLWSQRCQNQASSLQHVSERMKLVNNNCAWWEPLLIKLHILVSFIYYSI